MPFTPFHFGPGVLCKAAAPRRVSLSAFAVANVAIDVEPLTRHLRHQWPLHGPVHTLCVAGPVGLASGAALWAVSGAFLPRLPPIAREDLALRAALIGGFLGGFSHPILDGLVHPDVRPLWPFSPITWVLPAPGIAMVPLACTIAGVLGALLWVARLRRG
jgi:hypothetical protein